MEQLIYEIREEFQIPPYFPDASIANYIIEGQTYLGGLNPVSNLEEDTTFRMLLKNYVNYAYHHKINEFEQNYKTLILSWQLGSEIK